MKMVERLILMSLKQACEVWPFFNFANTMVLVYRYITLNASMKMEWRIYLKAMIRTKIKHIF